MSKPIFACCPGCNTRIGRYLGPVGPHVRVESKHFKFEDGTNPKPGSSSKHTCAGCKRVFDIIDVLRAAARAEYTVPAQDGQT